MRWRKVAFWSVTVIAGLLILLMSWLWAGDLGVIKPHVERWVSEKTGREFTIGKLSIDLGPRLLVIADDVSFSNAEWATPEHMVSVGRVGVDLVTSSLWDPPLIIEALSVSNAKISLTERPDAEANWALELPPSTPAESEPEAGRIPFLLRETVIQNVEVVYTSPDREGPIELVVASLNQYVREDDFLNLGIRGTLSGRDIRIDGELGTWGALLAGENVRYDINGQFDTLSIESEGKIDDLFAPVAPHVRFSAEGPSLDDLTAMLELGDDGSGNISLQGGIAPEGDDQVLLDLAGNIGQTTLEANVGFIDLTDFSQIDADVRFSGPDLGRLLSIAGISGVQKAPFLLVADIRRDGADVTVEKAEMVFGETQFVATADLPQFPALDDASLTLSVSGPDIARFRYLTGLPGTATGEFSIDLGLAADADRREFYELLMQTSHGKLSATGEIKGAETFLGSTADIDLELFNIATLAAAWDVDIGDLPGDALNAAGSIEYVDGGIRTDGPVEISVGPLDVSADGLVAIADGVVGTDLLFEVASKELRYVSGPWTDTPFVPPESIALGGRLLVEPRTLNLTDITGTLGNDQVSGEAVIRIAPGIAGSSIRASVIGDAAEELFVDVPAIKVRPGPFEVSGTIGFAEDALSFSDLRLERPTAELAGNLTLGLPVSRKRVQFDFEADDDYVHGLVASIGDFNLTDQPSSLDVRGLYDGDLLEFEALSFTVGDAAVRASGLLDLGDNPDQTRFSLDVDVPDMSRLGTLGDRALAEQRFALTALVEGSESHIRMDELRATFGDSVIDGMVMLRTGDRPFLEVDITSDRLVYEPFLQPEEADDYDPEPKFEDGRLIPDLPVPFDALDALDARLRIDIAELGRGRLRLSDVALDADLADGALEVSDLHFRAASGFLRATASLSPADAAGEASLKLIARNFALGLSKSSRDLAMTGDIDLNLVSTGTDLRSLLGNANGVFFLRTKGGFVANNRFFHMIYGDLLNEIIATINPFSKSEEATQIECIVAPLRIVDGKLKSEPQSFLRTSRINISAQSDIDLKTERLNVGVRTSPRKILSISAAELVNPYVKVVGTLAKPALAVDEQGVLITGGAAVATGGLSILAKAAWDRLARSGKPCETTVEAALESLSPGFPDLEPLPEASVATEQIP